MAIVQMALTVVVVNFVLFGLSTIVIALRCYVRLARQSFGLDDWLIVAGWVCESCCSSTQTEAAVDLHHRFSLQEMLLCPQPLQPTAWVSIGLVPHPQRWSRQLRSGTSFVIFYGLGQSDKFCSISLSSNYLL